MGSPHWMDEPEDPFRMAFHPVTSVVGLPATLGGILTGTISQEDKERQMAYSGIWFGTALAAYGTSWAIYGRPELLPNIYHHVTMASTPARIMGASMIGLYYSESGKHTLRTEFGAGSSYGEGGGFGVAPSLAAPGGKPWWK